MKQVDQDLEVIVVRHAIALDAESFDGPDRDRPLTKEGVKKFGRVLDGYLATKGAERAAIVATSPYLRANETAGMLSKRLGSEPVPCTALEPGHTPQEILTALEELRQPGVTIYAAGHNPELSVFAAACIGARPTAITLKKGGMAKIRFRSGPKLGDGELVWLVTPRLMGR